MTDRNGFAPTEQMLDPAALAEMLRVSERHLTDLRREDKTFPAPRMLGTLPRWSPAAIRRWMDTAAPCCTTAEARVPAIVVPLTGKKAKGAQRVH